MATLAPQRLSVTLPGDAATFLRKRAKREKSVSETPVVFVADTQANVEDETDDPFYSESNMRVLLESIAQIERGEVVVKTLEELEAMAQ